MFLEKVTPKKLFIFQEVTSRCPKNEAITLKKFLMLQKMELFNSRFKKVLFFLRRTPQSFSSVSSDVFVLPLIFPIIFGCFHCQLHLFTSVFTSLHFIVVLLYRECYGFERAFFTQALFTFYSFGSTLVAPTTDCTNLVFYQGFPGAGSSALKVAAEPHTQV